MTNVEVTKEEDWELLLKQEEEEVARICADIIKFKPDIVITEKGLSGELSRENHPKKQDGSLTTS